MSRVLEIEDVGDDQDKAFLMGTMVLALTEHLRTAARDARGLRHVTVIEEAHRLLRHGPGPAEHAVEMFAAMLAEVRAYGEGIVIARTIASATSRMSTKCMSPSRMNGSRPSRSRSTFDVDRNR